ncbi:MAG: trypsin-like peptidase domain-containing protein [Roseobacter sp.]
MNTLSDILQALNEAISSQDEDKVLAAIERLCAWLKAHPDVAAAFDPAVLKTLRNARYFNALHMLADTLNGLGHTAPAVRLSMAQALIDTHTPSTAIDVLRRITGKSGTPTLDSIQAHGLTGRAFKDLFVGTASADHSRRAELLNLAVENYATAFAQSEQQDYWTGSNLVGLVAKAQQLGMQAHAALDAETISKHLQAVIEKTPEDARDFWQWATLGTLQIGQQNWRDAYWSMGRAASHEQSSAFALASTIRQLQEIWDIDDLGENGSGILVSLQARQLQLSGGQVTLTSQEMERARNTPEEQFEKVFGAEGPRTRGWMMKFLDTGNSVGLISKKFDRGMGTCFVVDGGDFHASLTGEKLILTNDHVISPEPEIYRSSPPLRLEQAEVSFEVYADTKGLKELEPDAIVWSSSAQDHDACLIRLKSALPETVAALPTTKFVPLVDKTSPQGVYVIGHPGGRGLSYSMQNNELLDHDCNNGGPDTNPRRLHYVTPTEPGSSGSPAMNADLEVIGLHHAGAKYMTRLNGHEGTYPANEAIWIEAIKRALHADLENGQTRWSR